MSQRLIHDIFDVIIKFYCPKNLSEIFLTWVPLDLKRSFITSFPRSEVLRDDLNAHVRLDPE